MRRMLDSRHRGWGVIAAISLLVFLGESAFCVEAPTDEAGPAARRASAGESVGPTSCGDRPYRISSSVVHGIAFEALGDENEPKHHQAFHPRLATGQNNTIHLVWASSGIQRDIALRSDAVFARECREGRWGPVVTLAEGGDRIRSTATTLVARDGSWYVVWEEFKSDNYILRVLVGRVRIGATWSAPKAVSDSSAVLVMAPVLLEHPQAQPGIDVLWLDSREEHRILFVVESYTKIYLKDFNAPPESLAGPITPEGKYFVEFYAPVQTMKPGPNLSEILYFRGRKNELGRTWVRDEAGLYSVTVDGGKVSWPEPLLTGYLGGEREQITAAVPFRRNPDELHVLYRSAAERSYETPVDERDAELKLTRFGSGKKRETTVVARGVSKSGGDGIRAALDVNANLLAAYQGARSSESPCSISETWEACRSRPLFLLAVDDRGCSYQTRLSDTSADGSFDLVVDSAGRAHVVWVEQTPAEMKLVHGVIESSPTPAEADETGSPRSAGSEGITVPGRGGG